MSFLREDGEQPGCLKRLIGIIAYSNHVVCFWRHLVSPRFYRGSPRESSRLCLTGWREMMYLCAPLHSVFIYCLFLSQSPCRKRTTDPPSVTMLFLMIHWMAPSQKYPFSTMIWLSCNLHRDNQENLPVPPTDIPYPSSRTLQLNPRGD